MKKVHSEKSVRIGIPEMCLRFCAILLVFLLFAMSAQAQPRAKHVVLIGLDGWAAHDLDKASDIPNIRMLMQGGSVTLHKRSVLPSSSGVNWASMFMGVGPETHGFTTWDSEKHDLPFAFVNAHGIFPSIFSIIREAYPNAETGCTIEWEPIKYVVDTLAISYMGCLPSSRDSLETNCDRIVQYIREHKPLFFAPCFDGLDGTGHSAGWYSRDYYDYLARLDKCIGRIIQALKDAGIYDETVIIVTGDHGGHDKGHGTLAMEDMESPLVIFGKNVKQGYQIQSPVVQYDIAATIAYALGIEIPQVWRGKPVKEAFQ